MEQEFAEGIDSWETMMFLYNSALKEVNTKLEILNDEFVHIHNYNPIEYIKSVSYTHLRAHEKHS